MGSAAAWQLAGRGRQVTLLERFGARHTMGASHGRSRNFNITYEKPAYAVLLHEAARLWRELEHDSGTPLLELVGIVNHGAGVRPDLADVLGALGFQASMLAPEEANERWAGIRFDTRVLFSPDGGRLDADEAVVALQSEAVRHGGEVLLQTPVVEVRPRSDDRVEVVTDDTTYLAETVVVTAGAWTERLLGPSAVALPPMVVTEEQPAHFAVLDPTFDWPGWNHMPAPDEARYDYWHAPAYGTLTPGEGVKAGWHAAGPACDPDARTFAPEPVQLAALQRYAREWLPGVDAEAAAPISCTYTSTVDTDFVLDRIGPLVVGAGFSGHGFKFVPSVGRILADLATHNSRPESRFSARW